VTRTPVQTRCTIALQLPVGARHVHRTLTFWLRPAFVLRAVNRFQRAAGFDRAVALASSTLTALIPLAILAGTVLSAVGGKTAAQPIAAGDSCREAGLWRRSGPPRRPSAHGWRGRALR
jgi:hypothetical protein